MVSQNGLWMETFISLVSFQETIKYYEEFLHHGTWKINVSLHRYHL